MDLGDKLNPNYSTVLWEPVTKSLNPLSVTALPEKEPQPRATSYLKLRPRPCPTNVTTRKEPASCLPAAQPPEGLDLSMARSSPMRLLSVPMAVTDADFCH